MHMSDGLFTAIERLIRPLIRRLISDFREITKLLFILVAGDKTKSNNFASFVKFCDTA